MMPAHHNFVEEVAALLQPFEQSLAQFGQRKLKLIIHAGTPKTGTTSVQTYLNKKQVKLRRKGILYPHTLDKSLNTTAPKHQWFEKNLVNVQLSYFQENIKNIISQVKSDTHTIIISSEGIYNYWWDFSQESKALLKALAELFDINVWVWFREPLEFIESYYKQCIRNPQIKNNPCYGKDLSFAQMLNIEWFSRQLNYQGFVDDCQQLFGNDNVFAFEYEGDIVQQVIQKLGLATPFDNKTPLQNASVNSASVKLLRAINSYNIKPKEKALLMPHLKEIDSILERYAHETLIDEVSQHKVIALHKPVNFKDLLS